MEASSPRASDSCDESASKFLSDLPSRGFLSSTAVSSNPKLKGESSSKDAKGSAEDGPKKRAANRAMDDRGSAKRAANVSRQEGSSSRSGERDFQSLTVEKLRALLKERGLPTKGRKDELIARLKNAN